MKKAVIFEDNPDVFISKLLQTNTSGVDMFFSKGCGKLPNKLAEVVKDGYKEIYIFIDLVPDNERTRVAYNNLAKENLKRIYLSDKRKRFSNIDLSSIDYYVIPIFCIEYIVLKCIESNSYGRERDHEYLRDILSNIKKVYETIDGETLERKFKAILNGGKISRCFTDTSVLENSVTGKFYREDCDCSKWGCECKEKFDVKGDKLYAELPICIYEDNSYKERMKEIGIDLKDYSISELKRDSQDTYDNLCELLDVVKIRII